ncbi:MAG: carboxypeptidase regulatory-like domain-containing protein [Bacteroidetes bacterium]|nr:carboxypeptidase regulatory-like domain-containing protein [Bacteroidota bacterium]
MLVLVSSCKREDTTCKAIIKVIRPTGVAVSGANVTLISNWALSSGEGEVAGYLADSSKTNKEITDANGEARFEFKYPAILDVEVTHIAYGTAEDLIKLEPGETVTKTVILEQ